MLFTLTYITFVDHGLVTKLSELGVMDPLLSWFSSYLSDHSQLVKINNSVFNTIKVMSGVPQGGNLSLLFYIYKLPKEVF